jgi:hypothetical protein
MPAIRAGGAIAARICATAARTGAIDVRMSAIGARIDAIDADDAEQQP